MTTRTFLAMATGALAAALTPLASSASGEGASMPEISLPKPMKHPALAGTAEELARLQAAWKGAGPAHELVAGVVARADKLIGKPIAFPPRGGQHNQWYQCDGCQMALKTVDDTHHQCPKCGKVYTGEPYDDVVFAKQHGANLRGMTDAAWAWAVAGKKEHAEHAARVLLGYAERYRKYPYHTNNPKDTQGKSGGRLFEQTLNEASCLATQIGPAYDLIHDSGALGDQDHQAIRAGLILPMLENLAKHRAGKSNWQSWHNAAMVWGGALAGEAAWVQRAIADPENGFHFQMKASVTEDGMWYENSWGYHFYTLGALTATAEATRRLGLDLWKHPVLRKMFALPARYAMADGSLPRFGDDVNTSAAGSASLLECAYQATGDPALAGLLPAKANWESVMFGREPGTRERPKVEGSEVFKGAGHVILRTRGEAGLSAALTFGPYGGFHGHFDKLSFVFFGYGRELGVDPGRAASQAYRLPVHGNWYKATVGHNAVLVDGASQQPAEGRLEFFAAKEDCAAAVASCDAAYPGVKHRRLLCLTPGYLLVVDELTAEKPRRFDWIYHNRGSAARCAAAAEDGRPGENFPGGEYLNGVKAGVTDQPFRIEFAGDEVTTWLTAAAGPGTGLRTGDGVGASMVDRVPLAVITRQGRAVRFAAVLEPVRKGGKPAVSEVRLEQPGEGLRVTVQNGGQAEVFSLGSDGKVSVTSGERRAL